MISSLYGWKLYWLILMIIVSSSVSTWQHIRFHRDTYDEREKLISTYQIVSHTQCLLEMRSSDGYVYGQRRSNWEENNRSRFLFLPIGVNLFLIQHRDSRRYLCAQHNYLIGSFDRNDQHCLFESIRSDIDFGLWDTFHLFYEDIHHGYLSMSNRCQTRIREKYLHDDRYLYSLAFVRIHLAPRRQCNCTRSMTFQRKCRKVSC